MFQDGGFRDYSYFEKDLLDEYKNLPLPTVTYDQFEVSSSLPVNDSTENNFGLVILIGGETHGVSAEAFKFAHSHFGEKIYIPLRNSIESLNAASAASVIMFEIQKKMISSQNDKFK
jgi:tRNA G18 (ribose-2'-O)-methylase SpoU